ncbi:bifunctional riboflavin kinase/FAD synthetase [Candidatus Sumerlaeota bacterium]|nr:bifunctional riboflavin kinase/FAD synthetase [Candidatus Sumerlaeota bacterium]
MHPALPAEVLERGTVCCIGVFDGVHLGHQELLRATLECAKQKSLHPLVLTFSNHPLSVLAPPYAPQLLMSAEDKAAMIATYGVEYVLMVDFTPEFSQTTHNHFIQRMLMQNLGMRKVVCGFNFHFGYRAEGDVTYLSKMSEALNFKVDVRERVSLRGMTVSSSQIRGLLERGRVHAAAEMLTRHYRLSGEVVQGEMRGRTMGYPTANLVVPEERLKPRPGVYAVRVKAGERCHNGMINIGSSPTFEDRAEGLEAHLFDFTGDLYGQRIEVEFIERLRETRKFDSIKGLMDQLKMDESAAREYLRDLDESEKQ